MQSPYSPYFRLNLNVLEAFPILVAISGHLSLWKLPIGRSCSSSRLCSMPVWIQPAVTTTSTDPVIIYRSHQNVGPGVCLVAPGLLQLTAVRHHRPTNAKGAVCTERGCTSGDWSSSKRPHHTSVASAALATCAAARRLQGHRVLVFQSLTGQTPVYIADECRLVSGWWSACCVLPVFRRARCHGGTDTKSFRWQKFLCRRPSPVERSPINAAANWCQFDSLTASNNF